MHYQDKSSLHRSSNMKHFLKNKRTDNWIERDLLVTVTAWSTDLLLVVFSE